MKRIAVIANTEKPAARTTLIEISKWAAAHNVEVITNTDGNTAPPAGVAAYDGDDALRKEAAKCDLLITLGGDGTLLYGAHVAAPHIVPVLSVNLGNLGFHTQCEPQRLRESLDRIAEGRFETERRLLLQARLDGHDSAIALNDVVISKSASGRMVKLQVDVDGEHITDLFADGLLVATPTGSSAYNYAARGPVLEPRVEGFVLNAICPHRTSFAPVVLAPDREVGVRLHPQRLNEEAQITVDGRAWQPLAPDAELKISRAAMYLPLVTFNDNFFRKLRDKLAWGGLA